MSSNFQDLTVYKQQQVLALSPSGTFIDVIRDAPLLAGVREAINAAISPIRVQLPRSFANFDQVGATGSRGTIAQGNIIQYWLYGPGLPSAGLLRYQGYIDAYEPAIADTGEQTVVVTLVPFSAAVGDRGETGTTTFGTSGSSGTYVDPITMFNWWFTHNDTNTGIHYMDPLTLDGTNPTSSGVTAQYSFQRQNMMDILNTILTMLPVNWFFRCNPDKSVTLNVAPGTAQHVFYIGQSIANPSYKQDWSTLKNVIFLKGSGTLTSTKKGTDLSTYGERLFLGEDTRVTDQNTLDTLAQGYLNQLDRAIFRSKIRVLDYRGSQQTGGSTGMGYDIETLKVGDTCQIIDAIGASIASGSVWDQAQWDVDLWDGAPPNVLSQVVQIISLDYNFDYVDLELGTLQPSQDSKLLAVQRRLQKYTLT